jgi:ubiquinone/menaquinone biosynthesis C-methylase UbiE
VALNQITSNYPAKQRYWGTIAKNYNQWRLGSPARRFIWGREFRMLEEIVRDQIAEGSTILDAPTGTGRFLPLFESLGHKVAGLDISADMLKVQNSSSRSRNVVLLQGDCERLPFRDGTFDYIVSLRFLGHVPPNVRIRVLQEFKRVALKGMIVGFPVLNSSLTKLKFEMGNLRYKLKNGRPRPWWPASPQSLAEELERSSLKITRQVNLLGPFSQIVFMHLTQADSLTVPANTVSRQVHLASV